MYYCVKDFNVLLNLSEVRIKKIARTGGKMNFHVLSAVQAVIFFQHMHVTTIVASRFSCPMTGIQGSLV